jgi:hypothetical protein
MRRAEEPPSRLQQEVRREAEGGMTQYHAKLEQLADIEGYDDVDPLFECRAL